MAVALFGISAISTEVGGWFLIRQKAQAVADSMAILGANAEYAGNSANSAITAAALPAGYTLQTATGTNPNSPTATAQVVLNVNATPYLTGIFLGSALIPINVRAVAAMQQIGDACILASGELTISQTTGSANCLYVSNTGITQQSDATVTSWGLSTSGDCIGCTTNTAGRPPAAFQPAVADPYAASLGQIALPTQATATCLDPTAPTYDTQLVPASGDLTHPAPQGGAWYAYCKNAGTGLGDVTIPSGTNMTLTPGVYFFIGTALTVSSGVTLQCKTDPINAPGVCIVGSGVTFVFTGVSSATTSPVLKIDASDTITLGPMDQNGVFPDGLSYPGSAYSALATDGVLFWRNPPSTQDSSATADDVDIQAAGATSSLQGLLYFPHATVNYGANNNMISGNTSIGCSTLVAATINLEANPSGFGDCSVSLTPWPVPQVYIARIVE